MKARIRTEHERKLILQDLFFWHQALYSKALCTQKTKKEGCPSEIPSREGSGVGSG